jgi:acyl dehydratase
MPINPDAVGSRGEPTRASWTSTDALLYAVGVGAGQSPLDELQYTTENSADVEQQVLPTFPVVIGWGKGTGMGNIGSFNPAMLVHGEQSVTLHRPLPVSGEVEIVGEVTGIYDKGKGAVVVTEATATSTDDGEPLFTKTMSAFIRGEGGWGGDRGPSNTWERPDRDPDHSVTYTTRPEQALIYRLSGDRNPLHADPQFAAMGGFDRPILHGLCTYGFTGRGLLHTLCDGDSSRFRSMYGRFSSPVFPSEDLTVDVWRTGDGSDGSTALFQTRGGDGRVVLDAGTCSYG